MAESPLEMMCVLNFCFYTWGWDSPSSKGRTGLCFQSWGFFFTLHTPMLSLLLLMLGKGICRSLEPGHLLCLLSLGHPPPSPPIARVSPSQMHRHDSRKELLFSSTPWSQLREWSDPKRDKLWEPYLWSAGSVPSTLAFAGRQEKGNSYLKI